MNHFLLLVVVGVVTSSSPAIAKPSHAKRHSSTACVPGLAKKGCLPPGQAKTLYSVGHKFNRGFKGFTPYHQIPNEVRVRYSLSPTGRYIYDQNYIYRVDPVTMAVSQVLTAIFR